MTKNSISNTKLDSIGKILRESNNSEIDVSNEVELLQIFRKSHEEPLRIFFTELCTIAQQVRHNSIVSFRIKRISTIINKLGRQKSMKLSRMGDIAGCRCIFQSVSEVYQMYEKIKETYDLASDPNDYYETRKFDGYKSIHIYIKYKGKRIEVQLRAKKDHSWATLVEITDILYGTSLKTREKTENTKLSKLHFLLSEDRNDIDYNSKKEIIRILNEFEYIKKLTTRLSRNYLSIRDQWLNLRGGLNKYFLLEAERDSVPKIKSFRQYSKAESEYYKRYSEKTNANIVLIYIPNASYNEVSLAYSNYILTYHSFIEDLKEILIDVTHQSIKNNSIVVFKDSFAMYCSLAHNYWLNIGAELKMFKIVEKERKLNLSNGIKVNDKKYNNWQRELKKNLNSQLLNNNNFYREIHKALSGPGTFKYIMRKRFRKELNYLSKRLAK